ncbi:MAG TPA: G/U mismatch-specific DNA glycosylase [Ignavibacteriales bacterium]|nr:G/U mismatch-specific DNA glycosylase [Ignavibacteriales bacterium]
MTKELYRRPTKEEVQAAVNKKVPDIIAPGLKVLFCGINPGLYTAAVGHHFARPGNRFWPVVHLSGFSERLLSPFEERELLKNGYGITNVVERATAAADELSREEYIEGGKVLEGKLLQYKPEYIAILGVGAYRTAFNVPDARTGLQEKKIGSTRVWVLPSPSGLNAHYQKSELVELFRQLYLAVHARG